MRIIRPGQPASVCPGEDHTRLLGVSLNWAREFARRKHDAVAEKLYEVILKNTPEDQVSIRLACLLYTSETSFPFFCRDFL